MIDVARTIGALTLLVLPGAWITFTAPLPALPFWVRFLSAVAITPLVLCVQFYTVRLLGMSFETTAVFLVAVNLPALYPLSKQLATCRWPDRRTLIGGAAALVVPLACLAPQLLDTQARAYSGHAWMHADIVYMIANGDLLLDDPELVGVRLSYYWGGHVYHAVLSYLLSSPPVSNYMWINLLFLLVTFGFTAGIVAELGGGLRARLASIIWLCFGVNFVGYVGGQLLRSVPFGDTRYTPWLLYFLFLHQLNIACGILAALMFLLAKEWPDRSLNSMLLLVGLLLCSIGVVYPVMFPVAAALVVAKGVAVWTDRSPWRVLYARPIPGLVLVLLVAAVVTFAYISVLTRDRVSGGLLLTPINAAMHKGARNLIVTLPLLVGFGWAVARCWSARRGATLMLACGAVASLLLATAVSIPPDDDEYKFIFTAALCLAPFPALALEPLIARLGRLAVPALGLMTLVLAAPFAHKLYRFWPWGSAQWSFVSPARPQLDVHAFDLRLADGEGLSRLLDAIRQHTPRNSLLVADAEELQLSTLTRRRLYAPSAQDKQHPGVNALSEHL